MSDITIVLTVPQAFAAEASLATRLAALVRSARSAEPFGADVIRMASRDTALALATLRKALYGPEDRWWEEPQLLAGDPLTQYETRAARRTDTGRRETFGG